MARFQFSLRHLLIAVALFALYAAGVIGNVYVLADLAFTATVFILLTSILGVIYRRDELRSYWVGFAVFGWGYSVLAFGPVGERRSKTMSDVLAKHNVRCDFCGRFVSYADIESEAAKEVEMHPGNSEPEYLFECAHCGQKEQTNES